MSAEFERLVAEFEKFKSKMKHVDTQLAGVSEMQNELGQLEATASNADRSITVTAGPGGTVKDIQLTDKALAQSPQALSAALMSTIQDAVAESARRQAAIVDSHMGGLGINITDQVIETQAELLGTSPRAARACRTSGPPRAVFPWRRSTTTTTPTGTSSTTTTSPVGRRRLPAVLGFRRRRVPQEPVRRRQSVKPSAVDSISSGSALECVRS
ncbi:YbaB/EbfC family nucleoid-associated protein [Prauserella oleivorans]